MNFDYDDTQQEIRSTARELLAARAKPERVREHAEARRSDEELWREVSGLGWPGIAVAEEHGGQGLGMVELAILCEATGHACAPMPFLGTAAAALAVEHAGSDEQRSRWLARLASGEARGAVGDEDGGLVLDSDGADVVVLLGGASAKLLEGGAEPFDSIDSSRSWGSVSKGGGEPMPGDAARARDLVAVAVGAELTGIGQRAMEMAVSYAREREQFGRPIGAYQGVSHRCAEMLWDVEEARSLVLYAAWAADQEPQSLPLAAAMARARAADAAWSVTASSLQVHGGIGFTWEHDLHFLLKRGKVLGRLLTDAGAERDRVAELAGLG